MILHRFPFNDPDGVSSLYKHPPIIIRPMNDSVDIRILNEGRAEIDRALPDKGRKCRYSLPIKNFYPSEKAGIA